MQLLTRSRLSRRSWLLCVFPAVLWGQQEVTFSAGVNVVNVLATVRDRDGRLISNLTRDDFVLEENGRAQIIRYFSQETDIPLTIGLLVDTSASLWRVLGQERRASQRFLEQVLRPSKDTAFVLRFDGTVELLQDLNSSRKTLEEALKLLERGRPSSSPRNWPTGTCLYDAVYSARFYDEQEFGSGSGSLREGRESLERLSRETGGDYFEGSSTQRLQRIFQNIEEELRSQYNLGYTSDNPASAGEFRKIRLTTKRKGLVVQARDGCYAALTSRPD